MPSLREFYIKYPAEPPAECTAGALVGREPADADTVRALTMGTQP